MDLAAFVVTLVLILPAELPDKTFVATVVLSTRYRPLVVWLGVSAAFAVQTTIAVTAGQLLALLPRTPVLLVTAALFATGSVLMFRGAGAGRPDRGRDRGDGMPSSGRAVTATAEPSPSRSWCSSPLSGATSRSSPPPRLSARYDAPARGLAGRLGRPDPGRRGGGARGSLAGGPGAFPRSSAISECCWACSRWSRWSRRPGGRWIREARLWRLHRTCSYRTGSVKA